MVGSIIAKAIGVVALLCLMVSINSLCKVFDRAAERDKTPIAWAVIFEAVLIVDIALKVIVG